MATSELGTRSTASRNARWRTRGVAFGTAAALGMTLLWTGSAMADPDTPATSDQAQQAYLDSSQRAEALNEQVLLAQENEQASTAAAATAGAQVVAATASAADAKQRSAAAAQAAAAYQSKVDAFANASFRGARLSQMSVLLTAGSADDFLDQVSSLDRVAADTQQTLDAAVAAKNAAAAAQSDAATTQATAEEAKVDADAAQATAAQATVDVTARMSSLDAEAARYKELYNSLSEQERQAATAAAEQANEAAAAAAAAANPAAAAPAAAAPVAADRSENRTAITADSADPAAGAAPSSAASSSASATQDVAAPAGSSAAAVAVAAALSKVGGRYVYGAAGPDAFDCSGLTSWAWAQAGVSIPRTSSEQGNLPSVPLSELQPGDLVTYYSPVSHVAMYIGNGQVVHASTESKPILITSVTGAGPDPSGHRVTG